MSLRQWWRARRGLSCGSIAPTVFDPIGPIYCLLPANHGGAHEGPNSISWTP